ncbi:MAG: hypothetical protein ACXQTL_04470 [Methanosarcinales archaeon]
MKTKLETTTKNATIKSKTRYLSLNAPASLPQPPDTIYYSEIKNNNINRWWASML